MRNAFFYKRQRQNKHNQIKSAFQSVESVKQLKKIKDNDGKKQKSWRIKITEPSSSNYSASSNQYSRLAIIPNIPIQLGRLLSHIFRSVQYNVRLPINVSGNINEGSHKNVTESAVFDTNRPLFGAWGTIHPSAVNNVWKIKSSKFNQTAPKSICECLMCDANDMWMNRCFRVSNNHDDANDIYSFSVKATLCVVCVFNGECFFTYTFILRMMWDVPGLMVLNGAYVLCCVMIEWSYMY